MNAQSSRSCTSIEHRRLQPAIALFALWLLFSACTREQGPPGSGAAAPAQPAVAPAPPASASSAAIEIYPAEANRASTLQMTMLGLDSPTEQIQWIVDGQPVPGQSGASLACADITRGSEVYAIAHVGGKGIASNKVTIKNTPPSLTEVALLPVEFKPGDNLLVQAGANDVDGDAVSIQYLWTRNGQPAGNTYKLAIPVKRGDSISIRITPFDGQDAGEPIILTREIRNFPPSFVEHKNVTIQDNVLIYQAQAIDPDGDPVTFSLESAGEGLSIQSATGTLAWKVPPDFKGERQVTIIAEDGHGGRVRYPVTLTIK